MFRKDAVPAMSVLAVTGPPLKPTTELFPPTSKVPPVITRTDSVFAAYPRCKLPLLVIEPPLMRSVADLPDTVPRSMRAPDVTVPQEISTTPSEIATPDWKLLFPESVSVPSPARVAAPVPVMSPPKEPVPRRVPPETVNVPVPTGEGPPAGMSPVRMSVPPESVVPPVCRLEGFNFTVPGPATSTAVSPVKSESTLVVAPSGGASVTVAPDAATAADAMTAARADVILPVFLVVIVLSSLKKRLVKETIREIVS